jgi:hypothetical protein
LWAGWVTAGIVVWPFACEPALPPALLVVQQWSCHHVCGQCWGQKQVNRVRFAVNRVSIRSKAEMEANFWSFTTPRGGVPSVQQSAVNSEPPGVGDHTVKSWAPVLQGREGPKYLAIADAIAADVAAGRLAPGDRLPPQRDLAGRSTSPRSRAAMSRPESAVSSNPWSAAALSFVGTPPCEAIPAHSARAPTSR